MQMSGMEAETLDVDEDGTIGEISRELAYLHAIQAASELEKGERKGTGNNEQ
jgi:hypothetical protein